MNTKLFFLLILLLLACFALSATSVCAGAITSRSGLVYSGNPISVQLSAQRSQEHSHQPTIRTLDTPGAGNAPRRVLDPVVVNATLITGPYTGVSGPANAGVRIVDLDHGLAAGIMCYPYQGIFLNDTWGAFLWSQQGAGATLFHIPDNVVLERSAYESNGMTPDGSKVVGGVIFFDYLTSAPWAATREGGIKFLGIPNGLGGCAVAISNDGRLIAGTVVGNFPPRPGQAVVWHDGVFETLPTSQLWSEVGSQFELTQPFPQRSMNSDGSVIVGASGPSSDRMQATRWVDGVEQGLSTGVEAQSSVASFVADNGVIFGTATLSDGRQLLVRWDSGGNPEILEPPSGFGVVSLTSINTSGAAAGGWVAERTGCGWSGDPACYQSPFVWTVSNGFTILPQLGRAYCTVNDVSDDGRVAVGDLIPSGGQNTPPAVGFVWTADSGLVQVNDLMAARGETNPDYYSATFVSRDGNRVLVTGNPPQATEADTNSLILDLRWPTQNP